MEPLRTMGILSLNTDQEIRSTLQKGRTETVTLLIPEETILRLGEKNLKILSKRIPILLSTYGKYLTAVSRLGKKADRTLYQRSSAKSKMKRINVRIDPGSWTLFGALAQAHGVSRCYLFHYLLLLEELRVGDSIVRTMNEGVPTLHGYYSYILHLDLPNNRIIRRLHCSPNGEFYALNYTEWFPD